MKKFLLIIAIVTASGVDSFGGGPKKVAKINRALWPYKINSVAEFDFSSRMEMLVFVKVFKRYEEITVEDSLKKHLGLERISMFSINRWKEQIKSLLLSNFRNAASSSPHDFVKVGTSWMSVTIAAESMEVQLPSNLKSWYGSALEFYDSYIYEQLRLAGLFPRTTSEILTLQDSEIIGTNYGDKQFLLTFDDGPTVAGGNTDKLVAVLNANHVNGIFFVLGDMLNSRLKSTSPDKVKSLYQSMVLGSHGKVHVQHPKYAEWQNSLSFTDNLIKSVTSPTEPVHFRPPYGQRNDAMIQYLTATKSKVILWNIDSQDWNAKIKAEELDDRIITLMLLWRRGIILFHDIHPKAAIALPAIWDGLKDCGIQWVDVHTL